MISRPDDPYRGSRRVFRIALVISLLLHPLLLALFTDFHLDWRPHEKVDPLRRDRDEVVTISTAQRHAPRAVAAAHAASHRPTPAQAARPKRIAQPRSVPHPQVRPEPAAVAAAAPPEVKLPVYRTPPPLRRELSKNAPGTPLPKAATPRPATPDPHTPSPQTPQPQSPEPKRIASLQRGEGRTRAQTAAQPQPRSAPARYSEAQIAQIESDLTKSIQQERGAYNPLSNVAKQTQIAEAPKHYAVDFQAVTGNLRGAQGVCDPLRSWTQDGWDYYWAACNVVEPDGSMRRKPMPWPVRWRPRDDPWSGNYAGGQGPMPLPPPGWRPDPSHPLDPDFVGYLRQRGYAL